MRCFNSAVMNKLVALAAVVLALTVAACMVGDAANGLPAEPGGTGVFGAIWVSSTRRSTTITAYAATRMTGTGVSSTGATLPSDPVHS